MRCRIHPAVARLLSAIPMLAVVTVATAGEPVVVSVNKANIRTKPSTKARVVFQARRGDGLNVEEKVGSWYKLELFQGFYYVHESVVAPNGRSFRENIPVTERKRIYRALCEAEWRSWEAAKKKYPQRDKYRLDKDIVEMQNEYQVEVYDKYCLEVCRKHTITTSRGAQIIMEGISENWPVPEP